eukprot:12508402-Prorocentrum_lima.AAC.1
MQLHWDVIDVANMVTAAIQDGFREMGDGDFKLSTHFPWGSTQTYMDGAVARVAGKLDARDGIEVASDHAMAASGELYTEIYFDLSAHLLKR